jgi:hypothetical protein
VVLSVSVIVLLVTLLLLEWGNTEMDSKLLNFNETKELTQTLALEESD